MEPPGPLTVKLSSRASWATRAHPATASTATHTSPAVATVRSPRGSTSACSHTRNTAAKGSA